MSAETSTWLNTRTLIGFTDQRGHAWHYRSSDQGDEPNHYPGAVPIDDVRRRLFDWSATTADVFAEYLTDDGFVRLTDPTRRAVVRPPAALGADDAGAILGVFTEGYVVHQYSEWLLGTIGGLLDDDLSIGSAGLLRGGAVAWVCVEVPETITTPEGVNFRPNLLACTSHDGSLATTFQRVVTNVVCDNTMSAALMERGQRVKVRHSRYSRIRLAEAREALAIVHTIADEFAAQVAQLAATAVTDRQWAAFLDAHAVLPPGARTRARSSVERKRASLDRLWRHDARVSPWKNTAWGVIQAVNTWAHHEQTVRSSTRPERNMLRAVAGTTDTFDRATFATLRTVLA
jgi:phage/plasmid-like protein (TIGR03299 family)